MLCEYINIYLSIFLLVDIWVTSSLGYSKLKTAMSIHVQVFVWADNAIFNFGKLNNRSELISK